MKISIISMWYNEEILAPLFLKHYSYADEIYIVIDADTNDNTREICNEFSNVVLEEFRFPDMMNAAIKQDKLHDIYRKLNFDWCFLIDADEFIFPIPFDLNIKEYLAKQKDDIMFANMWQVYRHVDDKDIDNSVPVYLQRRNGDPNVDTWYNKHYFKPCIAKKGLAPLWCEGFHRYGGGATYCSDYLVGAHWKMADPSLAIIRRIKNGRDRQSRVNIANNFQVHDHNITEESIIAECKLHENDPRLF